MRQYPALPARRATSIRAAVGFVLPRFEMLPRFEALARFEPRAHFRATSHEARVDAARALDDCLGMPTGFFECESEPESLS